MYRISRGGHVFFDIKEIYVFNGTQDVAYPDFSLWKMKEDQSAIQKDISEKSMQLKTVFDMQEKDCLKTMGVMWQECQRFSEKARK